MSRISTGRMDPASDGGWGRLVSELGTTGLSAHVCGSLACYDTDVALPKRNLGGPHTRTDARRTKLCETEVKREVRQNSYQG